MGYNAKWVEENLGVTLKAIRCFEDKNIMPKNVGGRRRDYSEEDIDRIWSIRLLQGMGFSLKEIEKMVNDESIDLYDSLVEKIEKLEKKKSEIENYLGYAKMIKMTGRFPARPRNMGEVTCEDFHADAVSRWNVNNDPDAKRYEELANVILNSSEEEMEDTEIGRLFAFLQDIEKTSLDPEIFMRENVIPREIIKRTELGSNNPEVQLLVKMMYEDWLSVRPEMSDLTERHFAKYASSSFVYGDAAKMKEKEFGKEACLFIADAIARFGGFDGYENVED